MIGIVIDNNKRKKQKPYQNNILNFYDLFLHVKEKMPFQHAV